MPIVKIYSAVGVAVTMAEVSTFVPTKMKRVFVSFPVQFGCYRSTPIPPI